MVVLVTILERGSQSRSLSSRMSASAAGGALAAGGLFRGLGEEFVGSWDRMGLMNPLAAKVTRTNTDWKRTMVGNPQLEQKRGLGLF